MNVRTFTSPADFNEDAGASYLSVINSSSTIEKFSFIFRCETRNDSSRVRINSHDQNDIMRLAKRSQKESAGSAGRITLQRHGLRVLCCKVDFMPISLPTLEGSPTRGRCLPLDSGIASNKEKKKTFWFAMRSLCARPHNRLPMCGPSTALIISMQATFMIYHNFLSI